MNPLRSKHSFSVRVLTLTSRIPRGRVSTYRELARAMGTKAYRAVGNALHANPHAPRIPCHRVVSADGRLGGYGRGPKVKAALLKREGVVVRAGRIMQFQRILFCFPSRRG